MKKYSVSFALMFFVTIGISDDVKTSIQNASYGVSKCIELQGCREILGGACTVTPKCSLQSMCVWTGAVSTLFFTASLKTQTHTHGGSVTCCNRIKNYLCQSDAIGCHNHSNTHTHGHLAFMSDCPVHHSQLNSDVASLCAHETWGSQSLESKHQTQNRCPNFTLTLFMT